jgi:hypothetical protein
MVINVEEQTATTQKVKIVGHGGYGQCTRFEILQHDYAASPYSYVECLEIKNPPEERCGFVIHLYNSYQGDEFAEWENLEAAKKAFKKFWPAETTAKRFPGMKGFKRYVNCGALTPWFYAVGNQQLIGDYALPEKLQDDPFYRLGKKFVFVKDGIPKIKTCIGAHLVYKNLEFTGETIKYQERLIYFDDGTTWNAHQSYLYPEPRPLDNKEVWIVEAMNEFQRLLSGKKRDFSINFIGGDKLVCKLQEKERSDHEGRYTAKVKFQSSEEREGYVDFVPTVEAPSVAEKIRKDSKRPIESVEIINSDTVIKGKKWKGVFFQKR